MRRELFTTAHMPSNFSLLDRTVQASVVDMSMVRCAIEEGQVLPKSKPTQRIAIVGKEISETGYLGRMAM